MPDVPRKGLMRTVDIGHQELEIKEENPLGACGGERMARLEQAAGDSAGS